MRARTDGRTRGRVDGDDARGWDDRIHVVFVVGNGDRASGIGAIIIDEDAKCSRGSSGGGVR